MERQVGLPSHLVRVPQGKPPLAQLAVQEDNVGMEIAENLWREGFPADLIPSSEIENKSLYIDEEGWICYGPQRYAAVVLYHPEFEKSSTAVFFNKAAKGPTILFRIGDWTQEFNGQAFDGNTALPESMVDESDTKSVVEKICKIFPINM